MHMPERRRFLKSCAALGAGAAPWGCAGLGPFTPIGNMAPQHETVVVEAINAFTVDLFRQLLPDQGNILVSPFSVETALAMTANGAKGRTLEELRSVLHFPEDARGAGPHDPLRDVNGGFRQLLQHLGESKGVELNIANAVWGAKSIPWRKEFLNRLDEYYGGGFQSTDFSLPGRAASQVNAWVEKQTKKKIRELLANDSVTQETRMILVNAVYFHGKWAKPFQKNDTVDEKFHHPGGKARANADFMCQTAEFGYFEGDGFQALEMPYRGDAFGMIVLLPKQIDGLPEFEKRLTPEFFETVCKNLDRPVKVNVKLPRFKFEKGCDLKPPLHAMGIRLAFEGNADFSGMHSGKDLLKIDVVQHRAFIDVAEEGTEAAAATAVTMTLSKSAIPMELPVPSFHANHPFTYAIRHRPSGAILFIGRVAYPG